jgi:phage gpG-like protein
MARTGIRRIGRGFELDRALANFEDFKRKAPKLIANESLNHYKKGFIQGGGQTDDSKSGWEPRQPGARRNIGRGILVDTGALHRSLQVLKATFQEIIIGTTRIPYAARHNEGLAGMPKREYVGDSKELNENNVKLLSKLVGNIFTRR